MQPAGQHQWTNEARELGPDPQTGLELVRIAAGGSSYPESALASPDGRRFILQRGDGFHVCDLTTLAFTRIHDLATTANSAYSPYVYFWQRTAAPGGTNTIQRFAFDSLELDELISSRDWPLMSPYGHGPTVSPDGRYLVYPALVPSLSSIVKASLEDGSWREIFQCPSNLRHLHFEPEKGRYIQVQDNRGRIGPDGKPAVRIGKLGATHFIMSADGREIFPLPVGEPYTAPCGGHAFWITGTMKLAIQVDWIHNEFNQFKDRPADWTTDPRHPDVTLFIAGPGDRQATEFRAPEERFYHVAVSKCGRYFCCDSVPKRKGPTSIVVGKFSSGKYRTVVSNVLCYTGSISPSSRPFLTADLKHVVYRAKLDPAIVGDGGWYTHAARLTDKFLASLD